MTVSSDPIGKSAGTFLSKAACTQILEVVEVQPKNADTHSHPMDPASCRSESSANE